MTTGKQKTISTTVTDDKLACNVGCGLARVFATPAMIALMEGAASECAQDELEEGMSSVGTIINAKHIAATPIGMKVSATATITEVDGRRIVFEITASDEVEVIGTAIHERFIVNSEKFLNKVESKLNAR